MVVDEAILTRRVARLWPHLNERQRRLLLGAEADSLGRGGIAAVARAARVSRPTVAKGVQELQRTPEPMRGARRPGGGRKRLAAKDPGLVAALEALVEPATRGDPESPLRWTSMAPASSPTRSLPAAIGYRTVAELHRLGYSLQANVKSRELSAHPDRDRQFRTRRSGPAHRRASRCLGRHEEEGARRPLGTGAGRRLTGDPELVNVHDHGAGRQGDPVRRVRRNTGW